MAFRENNPADNGSLFDGMIAGARSLSAARCR
jgi:hypothetical protein